MKTLKYRRHGALTQHFTTNYLRPLERVGFVVAAWAAHRAAASVPPARAAAAELPSDAHMETDDDTGTASHGAHRLEREHGCTRRLGRASGSSIKRSRFAGRSHETRRGGPLSEAQVATAAGVVTWVPREADDCGGRASPRDEERSPSRTGGSRPALKAGGRR